MEIPSAKLKVSLTFQKNIDPAVPAAQLISIKFIPLAGNDLGDVNQIDAPQMRDAELPKGEQLGAVPVPVSANSFLVGLRRGNSEARNLDLMKSRGWMDIPMLMKSTRVAKLTLEKGPAGENAIVDAVATWNDVRDR